MNDFNLSEYKICMLSQSSVCIYKRDVAFIARLVGDEDMDITISCQFVEGDEAYECLIEFLSVVSECILLD